MTRKQIFEGIVEILSSLHNLNKESLADLTEETDLVKELGVPSSELVAFVVKAEQYFDVEFDDDEVDSLGPILGDSITLIEKALKEQK